MADTPQHIDRAQPAGSPAATGRRPRHLASRTRQIIVVRNGSFGLLWSGQLLSATGTWLLVVAVPVHVFQLTHSARDTGLAFVAEVIPMVALGPVAGVFADRWSKRQTMIITNLLRAASVLLLVFFTSPDRLWVLLLSVVAENSFGMFFTPAYRGVVPLIVGRGPDLGSANAWSTAANGITRLAGAPLGGALYVALGFRWVVGLDTISYLISASFIAALPALRRQAKERSGVPPQAGQRSQTLGAFMRDLGTGIARLYRSLILAVMSGITALFMIGNGGLTAVLVPYVSARLHGSATTVGVLLSGLGAGYLLSAYPGRKLCASPRLRPTLLGLLAGIAATFAVFFNTRSTEVALIALSLAGLPSGAFLMLEQTLVQRIAADDVIGRISAAYSTIENGATLIGALLASLIVHQLGLTTTANTAIVIITAGCLLAPLIPTASTAMGDTDTSDP